MKTEKIDIEEKDGKVHVFVQIPHSSQNRKIERFRCKTADVLAILEQRGWGLCFRRRPKELERLF